MRRESEEEVIMVAIGKAVLDNGIPKICIPIVGKTIEELVEECQFAQDKTFDVVELRIDFYENVTDTAAVDEALVAIRKELPDTPLLFTFRTKGEGGATKVPEAYYFELIDFAIDSGKIDAVDIEYFSNADKVKAALVKAKAAGVSVVLSNHDFDKTPALEEITSRLEGMIALGGDVAKIACMPITAADVLTLLKATNDVKVNHPDKALITMSMGKLGAVSRLCGETFGSSLTFGCAKQASAPGQVEVDDLERILHVLH